MKAARSDHQLGKFLAWGLLVVGAALLFTHLPWHESILRQQHALGQLQGGKWLERVAARGMAAGAPAPVSGAAVDANVPSGFYAAPLTVRLTGSDAATIRYTLDGSTPAAASARYERPLTLARSAVLRFRGYDAEGAAGPVLQRTYLLDGAYGLPVLALTIDPTHLWNRHAGIYKNYRQRGAPWQRPAVVEYFEGERTPLQFAAAARVHGNWSRQAAKKSFQLSYASAALAAPYSSGLLKPAAAGARRSIVLRAAAVDVNYRLGHELFRAAYGAAGGLAPDSAAVMLLLNGEPWGLYRLQAKIDENYLRERFGPGGYDIAVWPDDSGDNPQSWKQLIALAAGADLIRDGEFDRMARLVDLDNLTDYWLFNVYAANMDWPHNNHIAFRPADGSQPWRWISWDSDAAFQAHLGIEHPTLAWSLRERRRDDLAYGGDGRHTDDVRFIESTQIMRGLLRNRAYRERFYGRFQQLLKTALAPAVLQARFDKVVAEMAPHLGVDWARWPRSRENFEQGAAAVRRFIAERPGYIGREFQQHFARAD